MVSEHDDNRRALRDVSGMRVYQGGVEATTGVEPEAPVTGQDDVLTGDRDVLLTRACAGLSEVDLPLAWRIPPHHSLELLGRRRPARGGLRRRLGPSMHAARPHQSMRLK
jgi:hypothetical protein